MLYMHGRKFMIGSVFTNDRLFCKFIKIWTPIFARPKAITDLKNALYYPLPMNSLFQCTSTNWVLFDEETGLKWSNGIFVFMFSKAFDCIIMFAYNEKSFAITISVFLPFFFLVIFSGRTDKSYFQLFVQMLL